MKQLVINIPEDKYSFFRKVLKNFSFVEIDEKKSKILERESKLTPPKRKIWKSIREGIKEVDLIEQDKIKAKSAKEFLNEF